MVSHKRTSKLREGSLTTLLPASLLVDDGEVCPPQLVHVVVVLVLAPARGLGLAASVVIVTSREADGTHFLGGRSIIT